MKTVLATSKQTKIKPPKSRKQKSVTPLEHFPDPGMLLNEDTPVPIEDLEVCQILDSKDTEVFLPNNAQTDKPKIQLESSAKTPKQNFIAFANLPEPSDKQLLTSQPSTIQPTHITNIPETESPATTSAAPTPLLDPFLLEIRHDLDALIGQHGNQLNKLLPYIHKLEKKFENFNNNFSLYQKNQTETELEMKVGLQNNDKAISANSDRIKEQVKIINANFKDLQVSHEKELRRIDAEQISVKLQMSMEMEKKDKKIAELIKEMEKINQRLDDVEKKATVEQTTADETIIESSFVTPPESTPKRSSSPDELEQARVGFTKQQSQTKNKNAVQKLSFQHDQITLENSSKVYPVQIETPSKPKSVTNLKTPSAVIEIMDTQEIESMPETEDDEDMNSTSTTSALLSKSIEDRPHLNKSLDRVSTVEIDTCDKGLVDEDPDETEICAQQPAHFEESFCLPGRNLPCSAMPESLRIETEIEKVDENAGDNIELNFRKHMSDQLIPVINTTNNDSRHSWNTSSEESKTIADLPNIVKIYHPHPEKFKLENSDQYELSSDPNDCIVFTFDNCTMNEQISQTFTQIEGSQSEITTLKSTHPGYCIPLVTDLYAYASYAKRALCISSEWITADDSPSLGDLKKFIIYEDKQNGMHQWIDKTIAYIWFQIILLTIKTKKLYFLKTLFF